MAMMSTSVANSDGWSWSGPNENHRWDPWSGRGGQHCQQGQHDADVEDGADLFQPPVVEEGQDDHRHHPDDHEGGLALQVVVRVQTPARASLPLVAE